MCMYIEGFGNKRIKLFSVEGTEELFGLEFIHKFKKYYGVVDGNGNLLVPITGVPIIEVFATKDRKDYCFTRQNGEEDFESFHVQKSSDGKFHLKADITGNEVTKCRMIGTVKDNYWFIESITDGITEVCLYDVKKAKITTPLFTEISFEEEDSRVLAYVEKEIYADIDGERVYLTSLLSFVDYDGDFVAPLYDPEIDLFYEAINHNFDKTFKSFYRVIDSIRNTAVNRYNDKNNHVTEILANMYTNLYSVTDVKQPRKPARVLEFRKGNNYDKK